MRRLSVFLGVPLFDNVGNKTLKQFVADKFLYHIYSGNLSMDVAKKILHTVEVMQGTMEWLAGHVGQWTKNLPHSANAYVEEHLKCAENNLDLTCAGGDEFDLAVSRVIHRGHMVSLLYFNDKGFQHLIFATSFFLHRYSMKWKIIHVNGIIQLKENQTSKS